jgi:hypothetical protein
MTGGVCVAAEAFICQWNTGDEGYSADANDGLRMLMPMDRSAKDNESVPTLTNANAGGTKCRWLWTEWQQLQCADADETKYWWQWKYEYLIMEQNADADDVPMWYCANAMMCRGTEMTKWQLFCVVVE